MKTDYRRCKRIASPLMLFAAMLLAFMSLTAFGANIQWDPNGSGGWGDTTRWVGDAVPGSSDSITIPANVVVYATESDWETFSNVPTMTINGTLFLNFSGDHDYVGRIYGGGSLVKLGSGAFRFTKPYDGSNSALSYSGWLAVSNGLLHVQLLNDRIQDKAWPKVSVAAGTVLSIGPSTKYTLSGAGVYLQGICGDGVVSNAHSAIQTFCLMGTPGTGKTTPEFVFNGEIAGAVNLSIGGRGGATQNIEELYGTPVRQIFTNPSVRTVGKTVMFYGGTLYVASIGDATSALPGSLGANEVDSTRTIQFYGMSNSTSVLRYSGAGETVGRRDVIIYNQYSNSKFAIDGGAAGGLTLTNKWTHHPYKFSTASGTVTAFALDGSNAAPCHVTGVIAEDQADCGLCLVKRGSGTWVLEAGASRDNRAPVMVERGTLQYASIAEAGASCALGTATMLSTNFFAAAGGAPVPWAYRLGDGRKDETLADLATFAYSGGEPGVCTTRPIAVNGAARFCDVGGGSISHANLFSDGEGVNTLVLSGACDNVCSAVTNGTGVLRIVKEGDGEWRLRSPVALGGGVKVKGGRLVFENGYSWYKFTAMQPWGAVNGMTRPEQVLLRGMGLWNDGEVAPLTANLAHNADCDGATTGLQLGQVAMSLRSSGVPRYEFIANSGTPTHVTNALSYAENADGDAGPGLMLLARYKGSSSYSNPTVGVPNTHLSFVMRLPNGKRGATRYDFKGTWVPSDSVSNFGKEIMAWKLEGSVDGINWDELHLVESNTAPVTANGNWFASNTVHHTGYPISTGPAGASFAPLPSLEVAADAVAEADLPIEVQGLVCDVADGCGTVKGFSFADSGTISATGATGNAEQIKLNYSFVDCENVAAIEKWSIYVNGRETRRYNVRASEEGVVLSPIGFVINFR